MLYQQGNQKIEVIVRKDSGGGVAGANETTADSSKNTQASRDELRRKRIIVTNTTHTLAAIKQIALLSAEYVVGGIGYANGDQALQSRVQRTIEQVQDVTNVASSIAMGMTYGAWGGPIGVAVGGTIAAATTGASLISKYSNRERDYNYKIFKENNAIEYNRARASVNFTNGRLR